MIWNIAVAFVAIALGLSALLAVVRIVRGPSVLDRTVATEVLVSTLVCALCAEAAINRHATTLPIVISLSLLGFLGSVSVARFMPQPPEDKGGRVAVVPAEPVGDEPTAHPGSQS